MLESPGAFLWSCLYIIDLNGWELDGLSSVIAAGEVLGQSIDHWYPSYHRRRHDGGWQDCKNFLHVLTLKLLGFNCGEEARLLHEIMVGQSVSLRMRYPNSEILCFRADDLSTYLMRQGSEFFFLLHLGTNHHQRWFGQDQERLQDIAHQHHVSKQALDLCGAAL